MGILMVKLNVVKSLLELILNGDNVWVLLVYGGVIVLLGICLGYELVGLGCWVLRNFFVVEEIKWFMIEEGVIKIMIKLIKCKDEMG